PDLSSYFGHSAAGGRPIEGSGKLCDYLLEEARVACVPGSGFGTRDHIRLSYATSMQNLQMAMDRITAALEKLV
ncbi:uncharacterized protein METZ01_LOCUS384562, partial [marine metagenome]